jgi:hypothetical protein
MGTDRLSLATARADGDDAVVATNVERDDFHQDTEDGGFKGKRKVFLEHRVPTGGLLRVAIRVDGGLFDHGGQPSC